MRIVESVDVEDHTFSCIVDRTQNVGITRFKSEGYLDPEAMDAV